MCVHFVPETYPVEHTVLRKGCFYKEICGKDASQKKASLFLSFSFPKLLCDSWLPRRYIPPKTGAWRLVEVTWPGPWSRDQRSNVTWPPLAVTWPPLMVTWPSWCDVDVRGQTQLGIQKESWTKGCKDIWIHLYMLEFRTVLLIPTNKTLLIRLGSISIWHFRTYRPFTCQSSKSKLAWSRVFTMIRVCSHLYVLRVYNDHSNNFTDSIFIGEVFQMSLI